jgi:acetyl-CoA carboxylase biotin carboxyl carrier protein
VPLTFKDVAEILKLIDASQCDEVVLELEGARLVVRRNTAGSATGRFTSESGEERTVSLGGGEAVEEITGDAGAQAAPEEPAASGDAGLTDLRAPMVGTFYRRPSPDEPPFVEEGATVKKGDALCLIEVMKLFTTIEAPVDGTVATIGPEDATLVEFDQLLFQIRA